MKSSVEKLSETSVKLTVEVPFEELKPEIDKAYQDIAQHVTLPGFRRGKAPRRLIDARIGRGPILEQVVSEMLPSRYDQALRDNDLNPLTQPKVDITKLEDNDVVEFTAEVDVAPEITLPDFSDIDVTVSSLTVSEEEVDDRIEDLRHRFAELKDMNRELQSDDFAVLDLTYTFDAEEDGESPEEKFDKDVSYYLGSGTLVEGIDEVLLGLKAGDEADFDSERDGRAASVHVVVKSTKEQVLPEVDEEFVQLASEFDTVEELREDIRQHLVENLKNTQATEIRDKVLDEALKQADFELPQRLVDEQVEAQIHRLSEAVEHDESRFNALLNAMGQTREEFEKHTREEAEKAIRTQLFLDALAEQEKPEISQEEFTQHILYAAQAYGMEPQEFVKRITANGEIASIMADARRGKALAAAIVRASVKDEDGNDVDPAEYFGDETTSENDAETEGETDAESSSDGSESEAEKQDN